MVKDSGWSVLVELKAPAKAPEVDPADKRIGRLCDVLVQAYSASVSAGGSSIAVRLSVDKSGPVQTADQAAYQGQVLVLDALRQVGLPAWPVVRLEAVREDVLEAELAVPNFPDLLGTQEVGTMLGVTRQRLHELRQSGRFPEPIIELAAGPVWLRPAIEAFVSTWRRRPGRMANCGGMLVKHSDGSRSCTVCSVANREADDAVHTTSTACDGCPACAPDRFEDAS